MSSQAARLGFTLAEVLVTLGIIGVVSAMTIPTLIQNHQRKTYVTQLHKVYTELQQASMRYMNDHNALNLREAGLTSRESMKNFLNDYFKIIQKCDDDNVRTPCFADEYRYIDGTSVISSITWGQASCVTIASGATLLIDYPSLYSTTVDGVKSYYGAVLIDINGNNGPNIVGRDLFSAYFYDDGSIDVAGATPECKKQGACGGVSLRDMRQNLFNSKCKTSSYGEGCFGKILNDNWEMTY